MERDNKESLDIVIKNLEKVLKKHQDKEKIKELYERVEDLKEKRNID